MQETETSQIYFISPICFLSGISRKELCNSLFSVTFHAALCRVFLCASCSSYKNQYHLLASRGPPQPHCLCQLGATTTASQPSVQARALPLPTGVCGSATARSAARFDIQTQNWGKSHACLNTSPSLAPEIWV